MFLLTCPTCQRNYLVGARSVRGLHNVRPGVIVLELSCPQGHRVLDVTGNRAAGHVGSAQRVPTRSSCQSMPQHLTPHPGGGRALTGGRSHR